MLSLSKINSRKFNKAKTGFTLLELVISIVIASLLALAVYMVYVTTKRSANAQEGVSEVRDTGFILGERFDYALKHAGFINYDEFNSNIFNTQNISFPSFDGALNKYNKNSNDEFAINLRVPRFSNGKEMLSCGGAQFPSTIDYDTTYQMVFNVNNQKLQCELRANNIPVTGVSILADNILRLKVFYQVSTSGNSCNSSWLNASSIADWDKVCSVYIGAVVGSSKKLSQNNVASATSQNFELAPSVGTKISADTNITVTGNMQPVARIVNKIVYLRN